MTDEPGMPTRAWLLPGTNRRAYRHCVRWHRHWRASISDNAVDCDRCGLRWSW